MPPASSCPGFVFPGADFEALQPLENPSSQALLRVGMLVRMPTQAQLLEMLVVLRGFRFQTLELQTDSAHYAAHLVIHLHLLARIHKGEICIAVLMLGPLPATVLVLPLVLSHPHIKGVGTLALLRAVLPMSGACFDQHGFDLLSVIKARLVQSGVVAAQAVAPDACRVPLVADDVETSLALTCKFNDSLHNGEITGLHCSNERIPFLREAKRASCEAAIAPCSYGAKLCNDGVAVAASLSNQAPHLRHAACPCGVHKLHARIFLGRLLVELIGSPGA
mmetsp:Transcript_51038/g.118603  ORF Transcript_51038/g.118603 Transcript_51038/m.118603 type:complete len:278 (-) Transcript_51038:279-1112(-)